MTARIKNMPINDVFYANGVSVLYDTTTRELMVDTNDYISPAPKREEEYRTNPALMKVIRSIGGKATTAYLVDMRYVRFPRSRSAQLEDGRDTETFAALQRDYGTEFALAHVILKDNEVEYFGREELIADMQGLMARVDDYLDKIRGKLQPCDYALSVPEEGIIRPPKPNVSPSATHVSVESDGRPAPQKLMPQTAEPTMRQLGQKFHNTLTNGLMSAVFGATNSMLQPPRPAPTQNPDTNPAS
jgi:hypothetical protein